MNRMVYFFYSIILILSLTGCGRGDILESADVIEVNTAQSSETYVEGEDYQQQWNVRGSSEAKKFTKGENGWYYYSGVLSFYDFNSNTSVVVCNQPNCQHNSAACNAYLRDLCDSVQYIQYYDGNLYVVGMNALDVCVFRISADGSTHGKVGTLSTISSGQSINCVVHRGYIYCTVGMDGSLNGNSVAVYRLSLGGGCEAEKIYTFDTAYGSGVQLKAYGNYLYMQHLYYTDAEGNDLTGDLYRYQIHTGEAELLIKDIYKPFAMDDSHIYYATFSQVMLYDFESEQTSVLWESGSSVYFVLDGKYLYCDNEPHAYLQKNEDGSIDWENRTITVIDINSREIATAIPLADSHSMVGCYDSGILFAKDNVYYCLDLEQFMSDSKLALIELN